MKTRDSGKKSSRAAGEGDRRRRWRGRPRQRGRPRPLPRAAADVAAADHVDRVLAQWAREMPDVEIRGADVLNRARRVVLELRREIEENFFRHGLDTGEFDVLATLRRTGEPFCLRPTELYRSLMISSGGLTARLDRLEGAGLIRRRAAGDDARSVIVELTRRAAKKSKPPSAPTWKSRTAWSQGSAKANAPNSCGCSGNSHRRCGGRMS